MEQIIALLITVLVPIGSFLGWFIDQGLMYIKKEQTSINISDVTTDSLSELEVNNYNKAVNKYNRYKDMPDVPERREYKPSTIIRAFPDNR